MTRFGANGKKRVDVSVACPVDARPQLRSPRLVLLVMVVTTIALAGVVVLYLQGHRQRVKAASARQRPRATATHRRLPRRHLLPRPSRTRRRTSSRSPRVATTQRRGKRRSPRRKPVRSGDAPWMIRPPATSRRRETMRPFGELGTVGLSFVLAIAIGFGGGHMLDRWLGTRWICCSGFLLGIAAGDRERRIAPPRSSSSRSVMTSDANALLHRLQTTAAVCCARRWPSSRCRSPTASRGRRLASWAADCSRHQPPVDPRRRRRIGRRYGGHRASARGVGRAEGGGPVRFTRFSGVRYDCAFAPAPVGAVGGCVLGCGGGCHRSRPPSLEEEVIPGRAA